LFLQVDNGLPAATELIFKLSGMTAIYQMSKVIYLPWFTIDSPGLRFAGPPSLRLRRKEGEMDKRAKTKR
jgi:hypothetical protein